MKALVLPFFCCALPLMCGSGKLSPDSQPEIDRLISKAISKEKIPGLSIAVVSQGHILYSGVFGEADVENHVPVRADSLFRTASVAKPITTGENDYCNETP